MRRSVAVTVLASVTAALCLMAADASAGPQLPPKSPTDFETPARDLKIEPKVIGISQDGDAFISGPGSLAYTGEDADVSETAIAWTQWTSSTAVGSGAVMEGNCTPSCAQGRFMPYRVSIRLSQPTTLHGQWIFTRMVVTFSGRRPARYPRRSVYKAKYIAALDGSPAAWGFWPTVF